MQRGTGERRWVMVGRRRGDGTAPPSRTCERPCASVLLFIVRRQRKRRVTLAGFCSSCFEAANPVRVSAATEGCGGAAPALGCRRTIVDYVRTATAKNVWYYR